MFYTHKHGAVNASPIAPENIAQVNGQTVDVGLGAAGVGTQRVAISSDSSITVTPSGTQDENLKQVNGQAVNVGVGAAGVGTQRVAIASDSSLATVATVTTVSSVTAIANPLPTGTNSLGSVGSLLTGPNVGQTTSNTSAVQLQAGSIAAKNGMLVQALSTNTASVFIGGSGVTTSTGYELVAGQAVPFTASNVNVLYVIGANNTDKVCWNIL